jgi:hypothetical protein
MSNARLVSALTSFWACWATLVIVARAKLRNSTCWPAASRPDLTCSAALSKAMLVFPEPGPPRMRSGPSAFSRRWRSSFNLSGAVTGGWCWGQRCGDRCCSWDRCSVGRGRSCRGRRWRRGERCGDRGERVPNIRWHLRLGAFVEQVRAAFGALSPSKIRTHRRLKVG